MNAREKEDLSRREAARIAARVRLVVGEYAKDAAKIEDPTRRAERYAMGCAAALALLDEAQIMGLDKWYYGSKA
jgi:hypothetical protein